jgi:hypothetical protein
MKGLIFVGMILAMVSCSHSVWKVEKCREYKKFLAANWIQEPNMVYHFKDNPKYWHRDVYLNIVKEECLVGTARKDIRKIFGAPTKSYSNPTIDLYIYCMDSLCLKMPIYGGPALYFKFAENKVSAVFTDPSASDIPDNATGY